MSKYVRDNQRRVTIKDIAALAKVSIGTVDRVLHNRGEVNQETCDRVMSFVEELGYTPNLLAKSLASKKSFDIIALLPEAGSNNPYWEMPLTGIKRATEELQDFNTRINVLHFSQGDESTFSRQLGNILARHPDGIILAPSFHQAAIRFLPQCSELGIPVMLVDNNLDSDRCLAYFGQDAMQSGHVAARLMHYGLPAGSIVVIINLAQNKIITRHMNLREKGFVDFFETEVPDLGIKTLSFELDISRRDEPEKSLANILKLYPEVAGIFVTNSRVHKVAGYLSAYGKGKILLAGYDMLEANLDYVRQGIVDFLICQKPEEQGYRSSMAMFNFLLSGKPVERVNFSPIDIVVKENAAYYYGTTNSNQA